MIRTRTTPTWRWTHCARSARQVCRHLWQCLPSREENGVGRLQNVLVIWGLTPCQQCLCSLNAWATRISVWAVEAAGALGKLNLEPELVVPALQKSLQDTRPGVRTFAALALGQFGQQ